MGEIGLLLALVLRIFRYVLFARAIVSWIPNMDPYHPAIQFLHQVTEPVLEPVRRLLPPMQGFDLSFIVVFIGTVILENLVRGAF